MSAPTLAPGSTSVEQACPGTPFDTAVDDLALCATCRRFRDAAAAAQAEIAQQQDPRQS